MPWWRVIGGELIGASQVLGPYGAWTLTEDTPGGQAQGGWMKLPNETAARNALGVGRRVKGADRNALDICIAAVQAPLLRGALENLRNNDPDPEQAAVGGVTAKGAKDG